MKCEPLFLNRATFSITVRASALCVMPVSRAGMVAGARCRLSLSRISDFHVQMKISGLRAAAEECIAAGLLVEAHALLVEVASRTTAGGDADLRKVLADVERQMSRQISAPPQRVPNVSVDAELSCRSVVAADRAAIIDEISPGIYNGHDYLPFNFERFLADPTKSMLACVDFGGPGGAERVLGLDTVSTFDEGASVMFQALRVHPQFQRRGVAKRLAAACNECIRSLRPLPTRIRVTTNSQNASSIALHKRLGFSIELRLMLCGMHIAPDAAGAAAARFEARAAAERAVSAVRAAELWPLLREGAWDWRGSGVEGSCAGGLPLLSLDWGICECTEANLLALEQTSGGAPHSVHNDARFAVSYRDVSPGIRGGAAEEEGAVGVNAAIIAFSMGRASQRVSGLHFYATIYTQRDAAAVASASGDAAAARSAHIALWTERALAANALCLIFVVDGAGDAASDAASERSAALATECNAALGDAFGSAMPFYSGFQLCFEKSIALRGEAASVAGVGVARESG